jgi:hypothetical protein
MWVYHTKYHKIIRYSFFDLTYGMEVFFTRWTRGDDYTQSQKYFNLTNLNLTNRYNSMNRMKCNLKFNNPLKLHKMKQKKVLNKKWQKRSWHKKIHSVTHWHQLGSIKNYYQNSLRSLHHPKKKGLFYNKSNVYVIWIWKPNPIQIT